MGNYASSIQHYYTIYAGAQRDWSQPIQHPLLNSENKNTGENKNIGEDSPPPYTDTNFILGNKYDMVRSQIELNRLTFQHSAKKMADNFVSNIHIYTNSVWQSQFNLKRRRCVTTLYPYEWCYLNELHGYAHIFVVLKKLIELDNHIDGNGLFNYVNDKLYSSHGITFVQPSRYNEYKWVCNCYINETNMNGSNVLP